MFFPHRRWLKVHFTLALRAQAEHTFCHLRPWKEHLADLSTQYVWFNIIHSKVLHPTKKSVATLTGLSINTKDIECLLLSLVCPSKLQSVSTLTGWSNKTTECVYSHWSVQQNYRVWLLSLVCATKLQSLSTTLTGLSNKTTECGYSHWSAQQNYRLWLLSLVCPSKLQSVSAHTGMSITTTECVYSHWSVHQN